MKRFILCSLALYTLASRAADGDTSKRFKIDYLEEQYSPNMMIAVADLWCSKQPEHIQQYLQQECLIPMLNDLEGYCQKETLPMCKIATDEQAYQLAGMVRMTKSWTTDPEKSAEVAAHPEWTPWILALYAHSRYDAQEHASAKTEIIEDLLANAEQELHRLGYTEAYFGAAPAEEALCEKTGYTLVADVKFEKQATKIFRKDLTK